MSLTSIILLILIGLILLMLEILFIPGMIVGIVAVGLMVTGVVFAYKDFGTATGTFVLIGTAVTTGLAVFLAFRSNIWKRVEVQSSMDGKAPIGTGVLKEEVKEGDTGKTISRLYPTGKAFIKSQQVEVQALDGFIEAGQDIVVVKALPHKILVKEKKT